MNLYEMTYIVRPDLDEEGLGGVTNRVNERIGNFNGEMVRSEPWGRRRLAFPIENFKDGFYVTSLFRLPGENLPQLENQLRLTSEVLRFLVIRQEERNVRADSLIPRSEVARPEAVLAAPAAAAAAEPAAAEQTGAPVDVVPSPAAPGTAPAPVETRAEAEPMAAVANDAAAEVAEQSALAEPTPLDVGTELSAEPSSESTQASETADEELPTPVVAGIDETA